MVLQGNLWVNIINPIIPTHAGELGSGSLGITSAWRNTR
jgi:hypothetical protein